MPLRQAFQSRGRYRGASSTDTKRQFMITAAVRAANRQRELIGKTYRECPICASLHLEYEFLVDKSPVCGCQTCGLLFLNPAPEGVPPQDHHDASESEDFSS